jgi:tubulin monoglycylase TTLL3/8
VFFYTDDITAAGNMKDVPEFKEWLGQTFGDPSLWESLILPAMKHIIVCTTK